MLFYQDSPLNSKNRYSKPESLDLPSEPNKKREVIDRTNKEKLQEEERRRVQHAYEEKLVQVLNYQGSSFDSITETQITPQKQYEHVLDSIISDPLKIQEHARDFIVNIPTNLDAQTLRFSEQCISTITKNPALHNAFLSIRGAFLSTDKGLFSEHELNSKDVTRVFESILRECVSPEDLNSRLNEYYNSSLLSNAKRLEKISSLLQDSSEQSDDSQVSIKLRIEQQRLLQESHAIERDTSNPKFLNQLRQIARAVYGDRFEAAVAFARIKKDAKVLNNHRRELEERALLNPDFFKPPEVSSESLPNINAWSRASIKTPKERAKYYDDWIARLNGQVELLDESEKAFFDFLRRENKTLEEERDGHSMFRNKLGSKRFGSIIQLIRNLEDVPRWRDDEKRESELVPPPPHMRLLGETMRERELLSTEDDDTILKVIASGSFNVFNDSKALTDSKRYQLLHRIKNKDLINSDFFAGLQRRLAVLSPYRNGRELGQWFHSDVSKMIHEDTVLSNVCREIIPAASQETKKLVSDGSWDSASVEAVIEDAIVRFPNPMLLEFYLKTQHEKVIRKTSDSDKKEQFELYYASDAYTKAFETLMALLYGEEYFYLRAAKRVKERAANLI